MDPTPKGERSATGEAEEQDHVASAFRLTVKEGGRRLDRAMGPLLATGLVGGIDVSIGVFGLMLVKHLTGSDTLGSLAFTIGFIALTLGKSELFTENFLVPIAAAVARKDGAYYQLTRLWAGTAVTNLAGGWIVAALIVSGFPDLRPTGVELGGNFAELGIGWRSFAMAMVAGAIITVMTWMIEGTRSQGARIVAAIGAGFLLAAGHINHCIVASLEMFVGLIAGAPYGYADWAAMFGWAALGNMVGGIGLVTVLRFAQVGGPAVREAQREERADG